jgi:hypothetical protein
VQGAVRHHDIGMRDGADAAEALRKLARDQHRVVGRLARRECRRQGRILRDRDLVLVGEVVSLHQSFDWFGANKTGSVFNELVIVK